MRVRNRINGLYDVDGEGNYEELGIVGVECEINFFVVITFKCQKWRKKFLIYKNIGNSRKSSFCHEINKIYLLWHYINKYRI